MSHDDTLDETPAHASPDDKLIRMANQIASFFATQPGSDQATRVALHLHDFWDPRMRAGLLSLARVRADALHPLVATAIRLPAFG